MSRRNQRSNSGKDQKCSEGSGLLSGLLLAVGAGAVGYLANDLYRSYQEYQQEQQQQQSSSGSGNASSSSGQCTRRDSWEDESKKKTARKQNRDKVREIDIPESLKCVVCFENPREVVLHPCSHVCVCEDCLEKLGELCPICRIRIEGKEIVYIS